jgi:hypothetical protein
MYRAAVPERIVVAAGRMVQDQEVANSGVFLAGSD